MVIIQDNENTDATNYSSIHVGRRNRKDKSIKGVGGGGWNEITVSGEALYSAETISISNEFNGCFQNTLVFFKLELFITI